MGSRSHRATRQTFVAFALAASSLAASAPSPIAFMRSAQSPQVPTADAGVSSASPTVAFVTSVRTELVRALNGWPHEQRRLGVISLRPVRDVPVDRLVYFMGDFLVRTAASRLYGQFIPARAADLRGLAALTDDASIAAARVRVLAHDRESARMLARRVCRNEGCPEAADERARANITAELVDVLDALALTVHRARAGVTTVDAPRVLPFVRVASDFVALAHAMLAGAASSAADVHMEFMNALVRTAGGP